MNKDQSDKKSEDEQGAIKAETAEEKIEVACEECGRFGAYEIGGHFLCVDCYQGKGSCCQECEEEPSKDA